jgi:cytochrome c-type biogenesis protein
VENVSILTAFVFGLISFISPCVLPIVPGYLSFISGLSFEEMQNADNLASVRKRVLANSLVFVLGFSLVFVALGASASAVGQFLHEKLNLISKIAGIVIIIFGIHMTGLYRIPFLNYEKRIHSQAKPMGFIGSFVVGLAFAFGWTPCIGPILAGILALAAQQETVGQGIVLLACYSAGLGIPFLLAALSLTAFYKVFDKFRRYLHVVEVVGGVLLILVGILIATNYLTIISGYLAKWFPFLNEIG